MQIAVGTLNKAKLSGVQMALAGYAILESLSLQPVKVESGVSEQPRSLTEIITGATNRAKAAKLALPECSLAMGLESGVIELGDVMLDLGVCIIYDGQRTHMGTTAAFVIPPKIANFVRQGFDLSEACKQAGVTNETKIGENNGIIGILTNGRLNRNQYTAQSIQMAMCSVENSKIYAA